MPPLYHSRYMFSLGYQDEDEVILLLEPDPFLYFAYSDNIVHEVSEGEMLWNIAAKYYKGVDRPAGLWWVIADFQPSPVVDPTLQLDPGTIVYVPSMRTLMEEIFNANRRPRIA